MKNVSVNSQKFLLGLCIALLIVMVAQTTTLVYIATNMGNASASLSPVIGGGSASLPDMAGGC